MVAIERAESSPLVYVAMGASDAVGQGAGGTSHSWVARVHDRMPENTRLVNLGQGGVRLSHARVTQLPRALAARPDVVTIWLAVNDFKSFVPLSEYSRDLDYVLAALRRTGAEVYVGNLPDLSLLPAVLAEWKPLVRAEAQRWNAEIARVAERNRAHVADLFSDWRAQDDGFTYLSADGFHPSAEGYRQLAAVFWSSITAGGNRPW